MLNNFYLKHFFNTIGNFGSVEPQSKYTFPFQYIIIFRMMTSIVVYKNSGRCHVTIWCGFLQSNVKMFSKLVQYTYNRFTYLKVHSIQQQTHTAAFTSMTCYWRILGKLTLFTIKYSSLFSLYLLVKYFYKFFKLLKLFGWSCILLILYNNITT